MICLVTHSLGIKLDKLLFSSLLGGSSVLSNSPKASNPTSTEKIKKISDKKVRFHRKEKFITGNLKLQKFQNNTRPIQKLKRSNPRYFHPRYIRPRLHLHPRLQHQTCARKLGAEQVQYHCEDAEHFHSNPRRLENARLLNIRDLRYLRPVCARSSNLEFRREVEPSGIESQSPKVLKTPVEAKGPSQIPKPVYKGKLI